MQLRPINKTILIETENDLTALDENPAIAAIVERGIIVLPEKNSVMKLSPFGKVVKAANDCWYPFRVGQRIVYDQFFDKPMWYEDGDKRYRIIKEWYVRAICED